MIEFEYWKMRERLCGRWPAIVFLATNDDRFLASNESEELRARQVLFRAAVQRHTTIHPFRFIPAQEPGHAEAVLAFGTTLYDQLVQAKDRQAEQTRRDALRVQALAQSHVKQMQLHVSDLQRQLAIAQTELGHMREHKRGDAIALLTIGGLFGAALAKNPPQRRARLAR